MAGYRNHNTNKLPRPNLSVSRITALNLAVAPAPSLRGTDGCICLDEAGNPPPVTNAVRIGTDNHATMFYNQLSPLKYAVAHRSMWNSSFPGTPGTPHASPATVHGSSRKRFEAKIAKNRSWSQVARCSRGWRIRTAGSQIGAIADLDLGRKQESLLTFPGDIYLSLGALRARGRQSLRRNESMRSLSHEPRQ